MENLVIVKSADEQYAGPELFTDTSRLGFYISIGSREITMQLLDKNVKGFSATRNSSGRTFVERTFRPIAILPNFVRWGAQ